MMIMHAVLTSGIVSFETFLSNKAGLVLLNLPMCEK